MADDLRGEKTKGTKTHKWSVLRATASKPEGPKVFLCHASETKTTMVEVYLRVKQAGFRPSLDKFDLLPGNRRRDVIPKEIRRSDFVMVIFPITKRCWPYASLVGNSRSRRCESLLRRTDAAV